MARTTRGSNREEKRREVAEPASSLVLSVGKALNGILPLLCGRQVAETPRKGQLSSECGHPVQKTSIHFAFS